MPKDLQLQHLPIRVGITVCVYLMISSGQFGTYELLFIVLFHRRTDSLKNILVVANKSLDIYAAYSDIDSTGPWVMIVICTCDYVLKLFPQHQSLPNTRGQLL